MNECEDGSHECSVNAYCNNTVGSYNCTCKEGFVGTGKVCSGIYMHFIIYLVCKKEFSNYFTEVSNRDCTQENGGCDHHTECSNSYGTNLCSLCPVGLNGTGYTGCNSMSFISSL